MSNLAHFIKIDPYYLGLGYKEQHARLLTYLANWQSWWCKENPGQAFEGVYLTVDKIALDLNRCTATIYRWLAELKDSAIDVISEVQCCKGGFIKKILKYALKSRLVLVSHNAKKDSNYAKKDSNYANPSIYKTNHKKQSNKHTEASACEQARDVFEPVTEPLEGIASNDTLSELLASTEPDPTPTNNQISGEKESSGGDYITGHQASIEKFDRQMRTPAPDEDLTTELLTLYNNAKPEHWGECRALNSVLRNQIRQLRSRYSSDEELIEDWKAAILGYKASDFHNSPKFQSGSIYFLLDSKSPDRVKVAAEKWRSSSQSTKSKLAQKIVEQQNGRPEWASDRTRTGWEIGRYIDLLKKLITLPGHPDCPPTEWIETHYPEVFK